MADPHSLVGAYRPCEPPHSGAVVVFIGVGGIVCVVLGYCRMCEQIRGDSDDLG